jgi:hypothetical protein
VNIRYRELPIGQLAVYFDGRYVGYIGEDDAGVYINDKVRGPFNRRYRNVAAAKVAIEERA